MLKIITDEVGEADASAFINGGSFDSSILEFVDEGAIMIGAHTYPASTAYLIIKYWN